MPENFTRKTSAWSHLVFVARTALVLCGAAGCSAVAASPVGEFNALAFGSCNHGHLSQPMWPIIEDHSPDLFLWTGDVVYADTTDPVKMQEKYQQQLDRPGYQRFQSQVPIVGLWDDHDFGINNGGKTNPVKVQAQQIFLDFLREPADSQRRKQQGIYTSYTVGTGNNTAKLFLLDTRYHRDITGTGRADILGDEQWQWLEREIKNSTASINLIASGVSVMSPQFPFAEEWNDFKWARKRLFGLIDKYDLPGVLFLTGDRHFSSHLKGKVKGRAYHEFMSSGLTHYMNRKRVSRIFRSVYGDTNSYFGKNFSLINFHWDRQPVQLTFEVYDTENNRQVQKSLTLMNGFWVEP